MIRTMLCLAASIGLAGPAAAQFSPTVAEEAAAKALGTAAAFGPTNAAMPFQDDKSMDFIADVNKPLVACLKVETRSEPEPDAEQRKKHGPLRYPMVFSNRCDAPLHIKAFFGGLENGRCTAHGGDSLHGTLRKGAPQNGESGGGPGKDMPRCILSVLELGTGEHQAPTRLTGSWKYVPYFTILPETRLIWLVDTATARRQGDMAFATVVQLDEFHGGGIKVNMLDFSMNCVKPDMQIAKAQNYDPGMLPVRTDQNGGIHEESADALRFTFAYACDGKSEGLLAVTGRMTDIFDNNPRKPGE